MTPEDRLSRALTSAEFKEKFDAIASNIGEARTRQFAYALYENDPFRKPHEVPPRRITVTQRPWGEIAEVSV